MAEGLSKILESLKWYMALSPLLLMDFRKEGDVVGFREAMEGKVVKLYESLLEYQISCTVRQDYTLRIVRAVREIIGLDDWDGKVRKFQELEEAIRAKIDSYNQEAIKSLTAESNEFQKEIESLTAESNEFQKDMVEQLRQMNRQRQQEKTSYFNSECKAYMDRGNPQPVPGTCQWFQKHDSFKEWIENDINLLIVSADAGGGKSVLSRYLVDDVLPQEFPDWSICHFFFKDADDQKNLSTGLSCVIHQVLSQTESLSERAQKRITEASRPLKDWRTLWDILLLLLEEIHNVIILFDAFDEMDAKDFEDLMEKWNEVKPLSSTIGSNTKILITTRPYDHITQTLQSIQSDSLLIQGEKDRNIEEIQEEIKLVVQGRLPKLKEIKRLTDDTMNALEASFEEVGKDQRTYLWIKLAFELLENDKSLIKNTSYWVNLLRTISKGHIEAYEKLLKRVRSEDREDVRTVLSIVIAAAFPLTTEQLDIALAVRKRLLSDPSAQYEDEKNLERRGESMSDWIRNTCRCFVTVYGSKVYFMHQTAKEFLLREPSSGVQPSDDSWHKSITLEQANATISECWIAYICQIRLPIDAYPTPGSFVEVFLCYGLHYFRKCQVFHEMIPSNEASTIKVWDVSEEFQLVYYALLDGPLDTHSSWLRKMFECNWLSGSKDYQLFEAQQFPIFNMMLAAFFGHYNVLVRLVTKYRHLDCAADAERIVIAAAMGNNLECLQYLLSQKYPANTSFKIPEQIKDVFLLPTLYSETFGNTALHWGAIWGNWKMTQMLITNGANPNAQNEIKRRTPISYTIRGSWPHRRIAIKKSERRFFLDWMSPSQQVRADATSIIASGCYESDWERSLMKLFWENGANLQDALSDKSMLFEAITCGDEKATKFLLRHLCVDPNQVFSTSTSLIPGYSALHVALERGSPSICLILLEERANASIIGNQMHIFTRTGKEYVDNFSTLHLYPRMRVWDEALLTALLESGGRDVVNVKSAVRNQQGTSDHVAEWDGATCLHRFAAESYGKGESTLASCIEKLVREGANINEPNNAGKTPLHLACEKNLPQTVITLLGFGADPTLKDVKGRTPLSVIQIRYQGLQKGGDLPDYLREDLELCEAHLLSA